MKRLWKLMNSKTPFQDGLVWASESPSAALVFTLVWICLHVYLVISIKVGVIGLFTLRYNPVGYWFTLIAGVLGLLVADLVFLRAFLDSKRAKGPDQSSKPPPPERRA